MNDGTWRLGMLGAFIVLACFLAGYLLWMPTRPPADATPPPLAATTPMAAAPDPRHKYNVTIETTADWTRVILVNGRFTTGDPDKGFNNIEMTSDAPQQVAQFHYMANEVSVGQKPFATARIVIKAVVETTEATLQLRIGHGDNGTVKVSSTTDSFTNDRITGDGQNFIEGGVRLE